MGDLRVLLKQRGKDGWLTERMESSDSLLDESNMPT